ncbi:hypothetical protein [uncultured Spirosoma sp.]|uniref:hypothetical protein n=1 Tax=uncultured Spirosoma sp. TaxID=278208 RepID=UPI00258940B5|nr:hypothetical protein [uncultured Spirosoma sp.]
MCTEQKYDKGANPAQTSEPTAADYYPGKRITGKINHPAIPDYAQDMDIELKESINLMGREESHPSASVMLNAVYAAYALGRKMATPDEPVLPTVNLPLTAVTDLALPNQRPELEVVQDALSRYMQLSNSECSEGEREMLHYMLEGLRMETSDLIARLFSQTKTGSAK